MDYYAIRIIWFGIGFIVAMVLARLELIRLEKSFKKLEEALKHDDYFAG